MIRPGAKRIIPTDTALAEERGKRGSSLPHSGLSRGLQKEFGERPQCRAALEVRGAQRKSPMLQWR